MTRPQWNNTNMNSHNNMLPPETRNPSAIGHEKCNTAGAQCRDFKTESVNISRTLKRIGINLLVKFMKTQTSIKLVMKNLECQTDT